MQLDLNDLPTDTALLHRLVRDMASVVEQRDSEIDRLELIIKQLQRAQFGRRSERIDADQLALGLEDVETDKARAEAAQKPRARLGDRKPRRKPLPDHLPRVDVCIDVGTATCACGGGALHPIGESVSEMLDWIPAQLRVIRIRRPEYGCRACGKVSQAPAPERCANVFASDHLFADDTPVPVLDPGRGRTKIGRLWVYARDQRSWGGSAAPAAVFVFAPDRKSERPAAHLENFSGILHVDGYAGFGRLRARGDVILAACWVHMRRNFYEFFEATNSPIAGEALRRIGELYAIEERIRGQSPALRMAERRTFSKPLVEKLKVWFEQQLSRAAPRGRLADALRYALSRWDGLTQFLRDGRVELDTNPVERAIRPVALGRKNHLFAGSDVGGERWATLCSLVETCKMNGVEPYAYLRDVLQRMVDGHPVNRLDQLLPWNWKPAEAVKS